MQSKQPKQHWPHTRYVSRMSYPQVHLDQTVAFRALADSPVDFLPSIKLSPQNQSSGTPINTMLEHLCDEMND